MSDRLVKHWTPTAEEAFGPKGKKGKAGEQWFVDLYRKLGFIVEWYESDIDVQNKGIDCIVTHPSFDFGAKIDVKNNLKADGSFFIEVLDDGWLFNPEFITEYYCHVNSDTCTVVTYSRKKMQEYITKNYDKFHLLGEKRDIILMHAIEAPDFVKYDYYEN